MKKYLMLDTGNLIGQGMDNVRQKVCRAQKDKEHNPMFTEDFFADPPRRWEARFDNAYPNVIYDPKYGKYRVYYTLCSYDPESAAYPREERRGRTYKPTPVRITSLAYAESEDGVNWVKPELGLVDFEGSRANNMIFRYAHGTGIFLDEEEQNPDRRYKMVTKVEYPGGYNYMAVNFSEDGIHWGEMIPWPKYNPAADSHNFPFRDKRDGKFKVITRTWQNGVRLSAVCESTDFINWSEPAEILRGDGLESQVYSMPVFRYENLYLGLASMFHEGNRSAENFDTVDCELKFSTDCRHFDSVGKGQPVIPRGEGVYPDSEFDACCVYAAAPLEIDGKLWIYYMGGNGRHTNFRETSFGRAFLEPDKFAYLEQEDGERPGVISTANFHIYGESLKILADVEEGGKLEIALYDRWNGAAHEGFDFSDAKVTKDENGWYQIRFAREYLSLSTKPVCIMIRFAKARVYALGGELQNTSWRS